MADFDSGPRYTIKKLVGTCNLCFSKVYEVQDPIFDNPRDCMPLVVGTDVYFECYNCRTRSYSRKLFE